VLYQVAAEIVLTLHFAFAAFAIFGGLAVRWVPRLAWLHLPALAWGSLVNLGGWVCPLTPLEHHLRSLAGQSAHDGAFVEQYIAPLLYPQGMTREVALLAGIALPLWNTGVYAWVLLRLRAERAIAGRP
jgi:hypothetical protein